MIDRLVRWWLNRCQHNPLHVVADVLEGDCSDVQVQYCRRCGACLRVSNGGDFDVWRRPDPVEYR